LTRVYRILREPYAANAFDGEGAYRYGGRWSSPGTRLCYTSEHQSLAMLEYFVHLDAGDAPPDLMLAAADIPDDLPRQRIDISELPSHWRETPTPAELTHLGDQFVQQSERCILTVPSALAPKENNWLINPLHADFQKIVARPPEPLSYDPRMFGRRREPKRRRR